MARGGRPVTAMKRSLKQAQEYVQEGKVDEAREKLKNIMTVARRHAIEPPEIANTDLEEIWVEIQSSTRNELDKVAPKQSRLMTEDARGHLLGAAEIASHRLHAMLMDDANFDAQSVLSTYEKLQLIQAGLRHGYGRLDAGAQRLGSVKQGDEDKKANTETLRMMIRNQPKVIEGRDE